MTHEYFSIEEAEHALVLVRPVVQDIVSKMALAQNLHAQVGSEKNNTNANEISLLEKLRVIEKLLNEVEYHMAELGKIGCELRDVKTGIVDFPSIQNGRPVFLCWMLGETKITSWHEPHENFTHRKKLTDGHTAEVISC